MLAPWKKIYDKPRQHVKKQRCYFTDNGPSSQNNDFSTSHAWMWELDHKERRALKNWCFWTMVLEKTIERPLDSKEIKSVLNIHWEDWCSSWSSNNLAIWCEELNHWKDPDGWERLKAGGEEDDRGWDGWIASPTQWKDWRQKEKGMKECEMVGWHHRLDGHEFEQPPGVGYEQESLGHCSPWGWKEPVTTKWLNWTELVIIDKQFYMVKIGIWYRYINLLYLLFWVKLLQLILKNKLSLFLT